MISVSFSIVLSFTIFSKLQLNVLAIVLSESLKRFIRNEAYLRIEQRQLYILELKNLFDVFFKAKENLYETFFHPSKYIRFRYRSDRLSVKEPYLLTLFNSILSLMFPNLQ